MYITVLCKVVDNYGDIGVAWRMCRQLAKIQSQYKICLVVDDFEAFTKIEDSGLLRRYAPRNDEETTGIEIFNWHDDDFCHEVFSKNDGERLQIILELFQCGRPDWMEKILFEEKLNRTVQIIMIDYLTAEKYAEDFHCLKSLTRSAKVQKVNFMPGFTEHTGGLTIDEEWKELPEYNLNGDILVFTYENDWTELAKSLVESAGERKILVAQGRGRVSMLEALSKVADVFAVVDDFAVVEPVETTLVKELPYMPQTDWDKMMKQCSALVIRGEESMSRACLSGIPFIWQAYPQSEEYQMVKVKALLERMREHFDKEDFEVVEGAWIAINSTSLRGADGDEAICDVYSRFFSSLPRLVPSFQDFAQSLRKNGDLCTNLMTFIKKLAII